MSFYDTLGRTPWFPRTFWYQMLFARTVKGLIRRCGTGLGAATVSGYSAAPSWLPWPSRIDDAAAAKGAAESLETMRALIAKDQRNAKRIFPFIGGEEVNNDPHHSHHRYVIDFFDRPLRRDRSLTSWAAMSKAEKARCRVNGIVPSDYPDEVAEDWPDLLEILNRRVKPERDKQTRPALKVRWWQYAEKRPGLYRSIERLHRVFVNSSKAAPQYAIGFLGQGFVYSQNLNVFALEGFPALQPGRNLGLCWVTSATKSAITGLMHRSKNPIIR
jgi:hypothetical protein